jgi:hypothetical protein
MHISKHSLSPVLLILLATLWLLPFSCDSEEEVIGGVNVHLIKSFERTRVDSCGIVASSVKYRKHPFIAYEDLQSYDIRSHQFGLGPAALDSLKNRSWPVTGTPFAVVANGELIYTAYFWPSYSSMSCQWVTADPFMAVPTGNLKVNLGYPGQWEDADIPDHRNDERITDIFARDGKLKR